jgi:hypothetical protein
MRRTAVVPWAIAGLDPQSGGACWSSRSVWDARRWRRDDTLIGDRFDDRVRRVTPHGRIDRGLSQLNVYAMDNRLLNGPWVATPA